MLCSRCKERPAVIFVKSNQQGTKTIGYCLKCAKELGVKPVENFMNKMGITDDQLDDMQEQFDEFMKLEKDSIDDMDGFLPGGTSALPFIQDIFSKMSIPEDMISNFIPKAGSSSDSKSQDSNKKGKFNSKNKTDKKRKHLDMYCYNLTKKAKDGQLDRIIGRDNEIKRTIQILTRRTKNNPCLIGEPGVGKTAIAEGLAIKIANGDVPMRLKNKEIELLDLTALVAGTQFRGQFESRIKGLIDEVKAAGNIILFIDEVHNLVGTGDSEGSMNAANILKPALSRGELQVIGATTFAEYRKYIEKDSALERRFQPVTIVEPSEKDTEDVLMGIKDYYEKYHRVTVDKNIVQKAVKLSERYITDRFLPDKAIDLLDEACACSVLRNAKLEQYDDLMEKYEDLRKEQEEISTSEEINYERLAEIKYELEKLNKEISSLAPEAINVPVEEKDLARVVELWTGIPAARIEDNELKKLAFIEDKLKEKIIGQDEAVEAISAAIKRSRVQISPRRRPASFIFVGPTGVGKTELVKVLSEELFDSPETLIRLDMSEFMEKHSVSRIIGSPPGYVGYDESGQVTEKVRRRPYSVLLFDEIEKAHPDVLNILLQILDEGHVTDAHGRKVNFENTVIVMTSNAGSMKKGSALGFAKSEDDMSKEKVMKALSEFLRPEFLSRVDEIIVFKNLTEDDFVKIADLMLGEYIKTLDEKHIKFTFDEKACKWFAKNSIGKNSAARDLRNLIRKEVEDKIATMLIKNQEHQVKELFLTCEDNKIVLK